MRISRNQVEYVCRCLSADDCNCSFALNRITEGNRYKYFLVVRDTNDEYEIDSSYSLRKIYRTLRKLGDTGLTPEMMMRWFTL